MFSKSSIVRQEKSTASNRGKFAEGEVRKFLKLLESEALGFTFNRVQDAHAAGGRFAAQAGDFQAFRKFKTAGASDLSANWIIEVKQTEMKDRLPYKNYSEDKVARVVKRQLAGSIPVVLICHGNDAKALWRIVPLLVFQSRNPETPSGSWLLKDYPTMPKAQALGILRTILETN